MENPYRTMHLLLTTTTNLTVMVFSSGGERSQTVLPWQSEKLPFVQHAASVNLGSNRTLAARCTNFRNAGQSALSLHLGEWPLWKSQDSYALRLGEQPNAYDEAPNTGQSIEIDGSSGCTEEPVVFQ